MAGFVRLIRQKWNPPASETTSFTGRTVLITGATTGLGLEAAKKIACLEPSILIITARDKDRGERAKDIIERHVEQTKSSISSPTSKAPQIHLLLLNMSQFKTVTAFTKQLTTQFPTLDTIILNAGTASKGWTFSPDDWEEQLQVNSLSTTLLALLLLPILLQNTTTTTTPNQPKPHLSIVSSGLARIQSPQSLSPYLQTSAPLTQLNTTPTPSTTTSLSTARKQYARSKLVMEINMKRIATLPPIVSGPHPPNVIVNSSCPGLCATDLSREMGTSLLLRILLRIFYTLFGRSAEQGSNTLVSAVTRNEEGHGKMWKDDRYCDGGEFLESGEGKTFADKVWRETCEVLVSCDEGLGEVLRGSY